MPPIAPTPYEPPMIEDRTPIGAPLIGTQTSGQPPV